MMRSRPEQSRELTWALYAVGEGGHTMTDTGPFLKAALFCDDVIEGKDGVLSLIRVIDRLTVAAGGSNAPAELPPTTRRLKLVIMLVSGRARGSQQLELSVETPEGTSTPMWSNTVFLEGEDRGSNLVAEIEYQFEAEGLYWFDVILDGQRLSRLPFRVIYQRVGPVSQR
jgi:hypothetical protein